MAFYSSLWLLFSILVDSDWSLKRCEGDKFIIMMIIRSKLSTAIKYIAVLIGSVIVGFFLLVVAYTLPVAPMRENVDQSYETLQKEGISSDMIKGYDSTRLDNYTDGLMLDSAIYEGNESSFEKAAAIYQYNQKNGNYYTALLTVIRGDSDNIIKESYARYWHGYLVFLKPLLLFMNYGEILLLNMFLQTGLVIFIVMVMNKAGLNKYILGYGISLLFLSWITISFSLQFSDIFYIFNISLLIIIDNFKSLERNNRITLFFMMIGVCVSYLDILTYPIVSLGMPLIVYFLMKGEIDIKTSTKKIIKYSFCWLFGYLGMWSGKWMIASVFTGKNVLKEAILVALYRMSGESSDSGTLIKFGYVDILKRNFGVAVGKPYIICAIILTIVIIYFLVKYKIRFNVQNILPLALVGCMPLIWYLFLRNHSYVYYWMTYRDIVILIFSLYCIVTGAITTEKRKS